MKLKEVNDMVKKAKNGIELLAIIDEIIKVGVAEASDSEIKKYSTGIGIFFSKDGSKLYMVIGKEILEHNLPIPFDYRTAIYIGKIGWVK